ncbi:MAG: type II secretion system F family protein [Candidatus Pacearchaeota archaeon]|jgi:flagellar protein FlaJ
MKITKSVLLGIFLGLLVLGGAVAAYLIPQEKSMNLVYFLVGAGFLIIVFPFVLSSVFETRSEREKDEMFLEFARSLVEAVDSGTPISKSIINLKAKSFGSLSPYIEKLANQIEIGIPVKDALETFAYDTKSKTIIRAITLIREAEKTGGNISSILDSVATSVSDIEKLKAERRSAISSIVMEGYIIFIVFIVIMVIMEIKIIPMTSTINTISNTASQMDIAGIGGGNAIPSSQYSIAFLSLLATQGLFSGLVIGKLAEGTIKAGIKHSFISVAMALLISTGARIFLG